MRSMPIITVMTNFTSDEKISLFVVFDVFEETSSRDSDDGVLFLSPYIKTVDFSEDLSVSRCDGAIFPGSCSGSS